MAFQFSFLYYYILEIKLNLCFASNEYRVLIIKIDYSVYEYELINMYKYLI